MHGFRLTGETRAAALVVALLLPAGAAAQNRLVLNPDFDDATAATGWTGSSPSWDGDDDADGCHARATGSGSLVAESIEDGGGTGVSLAIATATDCLNVQPGVEIETEIAFRSSFPVGAAGSYFPLADCAGLPDEAVPTESTDGTGAWLRHRQTLVTPPNRISLRVVWFSYDIANSLFEARFDRAYAGTTERLFADGFEASAPCRWTVASGFDSIPPSTPGAISSPSHAGGPAPPPLQIVWGVSVDTGGSGLEDYRIGFLLTDPGSPACEELVPIGTTPQFQTSTGIQEGAYYAYVCAEDGAGNFSAVVQGGPYNVN